MEKTRLRLIHEQPYYALFLNQCRVFWDNSVGTAGVKISKGGEIHMMVSREFWDTLTEPHQCGLLIHEMLHTMFMHLEERSYGGAKGGLHHKIANYAMDIAINQMIDRHLLPPGGLLPSTYNLPKNLAYEPYYIELMKQEKENPGSVSGTGETLDNHDFFGNEAVGGIDVPKVIADAMEKAMQECQERFPGKVPHEIHRVLQELRKAAKVNWKNELRRFVGRNLSDHAQSTRTRPNRRLGLEAMGVKREYIPKVLILCDHSGSVSDEQASELVNEMRGILKATMEKTEVAFFDTEIGTKCKLRTFSEIPPRTKSGGTSFEAAFKYAREFKPDLLIMLTDGGDSMPQERIKFPVMWCIVGGYKNPDLKGTVVEI